MEKHTSKRPPKRRTAPPRRLNPLAIGIGLGVVLLGGTAVVTLLDKDQQHSKAAALPAGGIPTTPASAAPAANPALAQPLAAFVLPPASPGTKVPINDIDDFSGKKVGPSSPTIEYKGYVIAFCCADSAGWKGGWERLSESEKDALVRKHLGY